MVVDAPAKPVAPDALGPAPRGLVVALIPAHDEEEQIEGAIESLREQVSPPDLIILCADNCTDRTAERAEAAGAIVFETVDNPHKKAGALNQALDILLPHLRDEDAVLVMDADSILVPSFVAAAQRHLRDDVGGVGGVFTGRDGGGFVGMLQRNEYARYARDVARLNGKVLVLTGTATLFSARTLRHVAWARAEGLLPGDNAQVYDTNVLTEDKDGGRMAVEVSSVQLMRGNRVVGVFGQARHMQSDAAPAAAHPALTPRQTEVLRLLERGRSTTEIAEELKLSRETVQNHVRHLLRALGVHTRLEAVAVARREHLAA